MVKNKVKSMDSHGWKAKEWVKIEKNAFFFEKKRRNILRNQKNAIPLHRN